MDEEELYKWQYRPKRPRRTLGRSQNRSQPKKMRAAFRRLHERANQIEIVDEQVQQDSVQQTQNSLNQTKTKRV
jgi:hypothetical protein